MGYGGNTTALGVLVAEMYRHPASFFVSISYMCWCVPAQLTDPRTPTGQPSFDLIRERSP